MQPAFIKHLVETQPLASLRAAESALLRGQLPPFAVAGEAAGDQLTHVLAAIFVREYMQQHQAGFGAAVRVFFRKVRAAISQ